MTGDLSEIVETLQRLGLSNYEARTFLALHRLGQASAGEVAEVSDVPRSQVYGAAERLEDRGLIDSQQGTPTKYRPVSLEDARAILLEDLERAGESAFAGLETVRGELGGRVERSEAIWVLEGADQVVDRTAQLIGTANERVLYGLPDPGYLEEPVTSALLGRSEAGVETVAVSTNPDVLEALEDLPGIESVRVPGLSLSDLPSGRTLLVDGKAVLLSVTAEGGAETAFYSEDSAFARVLVVIIDGWLNSLLDGFGAG